MYVQQICSILFFPKRTKGNAATGKVPVYARLVIDGQKVDRAVRGIVIDPDHWHPETKLVKSGDPKAKAHNKRLAQLTTDLLRAIDLVKAQQSLATPQAVWDMLEAPNRPCETQQEQKTNLSFSVKLDEMVKDFVV